MKRTRNYDFTFSDDEKQEEKKEYKFLSKIAAMMYTFGDVNEPLPESVKLMHTILRDQMNILLKNAREIASIRRRKEISHEEVLWLIRKNKVKLRGLLEYLQVLDLKEKLGFQARMGVCEDDSLESKKRLNMCMEFLASIEDCEELTSVLHDESIWTKYSRGRMEKRSMMTELMNLSEYEEFSKALKVSFCPASEVTKFRKWLMEGQITKMQFTQLSLVMIGFLVREMIAEIVDRVLCMRSKKSNRTEHCEHCTLFFCPGDRHNQMETRFLKVFEENKISGLEQSINISEKEISVFADKTFVDNLTKNRQDNSKSLNASDKVVSPKEDTSCFFEENELGDKASPVSKILSSQEFEDVSDNEDIHDTKISSENTAGMSTKMQANMDTSSASNYPEALKKEFLERKAITPDEIREVFAQFYEPSPLAYFFTNAPLHCERKLFLGEPWEY